MEALKRRIKEYWSEGPPMGFVDKPMSYEEKRRFRYSLQDYMHDAFRFEEYADKLVLDLGCGAGIDSAEFAKNGAEVCAALTKNLLREGGFTPHALQADATSLPFKEGAFDCVYAFGVLHHIPEVERALAEVHRALKPGGRVMAMLYHRGSLLYAYSVVYLRGVREGLLGKLTLNEILSRYSERREGCPYTRAYSKLEAKELFEKFFVEVQVEVRYNVIDLPNERKVKVGIPDSYELGWHLIVKAVKREQ